MVTLNDSAAFQPSVIAGAQAKPAVEGLALWDLWPVQTDNGVIAEVQGGSLWVVLSAPREADPDLRHNVARMRLFHCVQDRWMDCGNLLPDGHSPGSREWSGSTRLDPATGEVTQWFTAAGRRGEASPSFEQRLFHCIGRLDLTDAHPRVVNWQAPVQSVSNDGSLYADLTAHQGVPGQIKGFRDPHWFRDPADGQGYLLFTGSKPHSTSTSSHDGVIGIASADTVDGRSTFRLLPALIDSDGLANELECPHIVVHHGLYYVFWSTQRHVFLPGGPTGPTGLYGMVAPSLFGPYTPLNGSGLVIANPAAEPRQAYAWRVMPTLEVASFIDYWGLEGRSIDADPALKAAQFGGTMAPMLKIDLNGPTTRLL
jgi:levansucrase